MQWFLSSPIALAVTASLLYGIGSPFIRLSGQFGTSPNALLFMSGMGYLTVSLISTPLAPIRFTASAGFWMAVLYGLLFGVGFRLQSFAMTLPTGLATIVLAIIASFPLTSILIEIAFMDGWKRLNIPLAVTGTALIIIGAICVSNSLKG